MAPQPHENPGSGGDLTVDLATVGTAGRAAQRLSITLSGMVSQVGTASNAAALHGGLTVGPTLDSVIPLWETHLRKVAGDVEQTGTDLVTSSGTYQTVEDNITNSFRLLGTRRGGRTVPA